MRLPLALLLALAPPVPLAPADLDSAVADHMEVTGVPGLAYAVVGPDGIEHEGYEGVDGEGTPVDADTPFLWGSVAKPVTATAALLLEDQGRLDLDAPVDTYLPEFASFGADPTVRDLLYQTSGITLGIGTEVSDHYGTDAPSLEDRVAQIAASEPGEPGTHEYSSANYLVAGAVMERVTGDFAGFLRDEVLAPAGMDSALTGSEEARRAGLVPGHRLWWGTPVADATGVDDSGAAYGYLGGTLADLAAFARMQLEEDPPLLDAPSLARAREGAVPVPGSAQEYGLGWRETVLSGTEETVFFHGGAVPGYVALLVVLPERERAVVVLQNAYSMLADMHFQALGLNLARLVAGADTRGPVGAAPYGAAVWGATGVVAVVGAVTLWPGRGRRLAALRAVVGAAAVAAAVLLLSAAGPRPALLWLPDVAVAAVAAGALGAVAAARAAVTLARRT